jgi:hypothetical protein
VNRITVVSKVESLSTAVKHHWFGDMSPWTEQQLDYYYNFNGPRSRPAKVVILDRENPPQPRSDSSLEMERGWD